MNFFYVYIFENWILYRLQIVTSSNFALIPIREFFKTFINVSGRKVFHIIKVNFYELMPDTLKHFDQKSKLRKNRKSFMFMIFCELCIRNLLNATRLYLFYLDEYTLNFCFHTTSESQPSFYSIYQVLLP